MADLSEYEKQRLANIAQNNAYLQQLGLLEGGLRIAPAPKSISRNRTDEDEIPAQPAQPTRRSARVANLEPAYYGDIDLEEKKILKIEREEERQRRSSNKRQISHVIRYDDNSMHDVANSRKKLERSVASFIAKEDEIAEADSTPSNEYLKMLRDYCFDVKHLQNAGYPSAWLQRTSF